MKTLIMCITLMFTLNLQASECGDDCDNCLNKEPFIEQVEKVSLPAEVTIYTDFGCHYCKTGAEVVADLKKKYGESLKVKVLAFPLNKGGSSELAAKYYESMRLIQPQKALDFYHKIYKEGLKTEESLTKGAVELGVSFDEIQVAFNSVRVEHMLEETRNNAARLSIKAAPTFVINDRHYITGARPMSYFEDIFESAN